MINDNRPIGVFDSGVGGLTVLKELVQNFPDESFVYVGDTARLPYGSKSAVTIRRYSEQIIHFLKRNDVKAVVIACNTASAQVPEADMFGLPIYNVITPGAKQALAKSRGLRIGVLGTKATIASQAYEKRLRDLEPQVEVFNQACPLFVPLAEEAWDGDPITNLIAFRYLQPLMQMQVDTLILGCTHYPLLKNSIFRVTGPHVELVDSGEAICKWIREDILNGRIKASAPKERSVTLLTTDQSELFNQIAQKVLTTSLTSFSVVDVTNPA